MIRKMLLWPAWMLLLTVVSTGLLPAETAPATMSSSTGSQLQTAVLPAALPKQRARSVSGPHKAHTSQLSFEGMHRFDTYGLIEFEDEARIIDYPILSVSEGCITALQLSMPFNAAKTEILNITTPHAEDQLAYRITGNALELQLSRPSPAEIRAGDTLAILKLYLKQRITHHIDRYFRIAPQGFKVSLADLKTDSSWRIALPAVALYYYESEQDSAESASQPQLIADFSAQAPNRETVLKPQGHQIDRIEILSVIPNPMKTWADITYSVYGDCAVRLKLYTLLGEEAMSIVNAIRQSGLYRHNISPADLSAGIYILRIETAHGHQIDSDVVKVVVQR